VFVRADTFQVKVIIEKEARAYPNGASGLAGKYETGSKKLCRDRRPSLLVKSGNDEDKKVLVQ
jgi:hypothetical protein